MTIFSSDRIGAGYSAFADISISKDMLSVSFVDITGSIVYAMEVAAKKPKTEDVNSNTTDDVIDEQVPVEAPVQAPVGDDKSDVANNGDQSDGAADSVENKGENNEAAGQSGTGNDTNQNEEKYGGWKQWLYTLAGLSGMGVLIAAGSWRLRSSSRRQVKENPSAPFLPTDPAVSEKNLPKLSSSKQLSNPGFDPSSTSLMGDFHDSEKERINRRNALLVEVEDGHYKNNLASV